MNKKFTKIDILDEPIEHNDEIISTHDELAIKALEQDTFLKSVVNNKIESNTSFVKNNEMMPKNTPKELLNYISDHENSDTKKLEEAIKKHGCFLSNGQILYHSGKLDSQEKRVLSTSISPGIAVANGVYDDKAYDDDELILFQIKINNDSTIGYLLPEDKKLTIDEKEILFPSDITLKKEAKVKVGKTKVPKKNGLQTIKKEVPIYLVKATIE